MTLNDFYKHDFRSMERFLAAGLKTEEERINNNIKVLTENTIFALQLQNTKAGRTPKMPEAVDFGVSLTTDTSDSSDLKDLRKHFDFLKSRGIDPVEHALMLEQEALNGRQ